MGVWVIMARFKLKVEGLDDLKLVGTVLNSLSKGRGF